MAQVQGLLEACRGADLLISTSLRLLGYIAANSLGIPWLTVSLNAYTFWEPNTRQQVQDQHALRQREYEHFSALANQAFAELGVAKKVQPWTPGWLFAPPYTIGQQPVSGKAPAGSVPALFQH